MKNFAEEGDTLTLLSGAKHSLQGSLAIQICQLETKLYAFNDRQQQCTN